MKNPKVKMIHVGGWLRNVFSFYQLHIPPTIPCHDSVIYDMLGLGSRNIPIQKAVLKGKHMNNYYPESQWQKKITDALCNKNQADREQLQIAVGDIPNCSQNATELTNNWYKHFISYIHHTEKNIEVIENLSNEEYDQLLTENIVFLNLVDASTVNTVLECIVRNTPIFVNRHPAVVEMLGPSYPLFYDHTENIFEINTQIMKLLNNGRSIKNAYEYLKRMDKTKFQINSFVNVLTKIMKHYTN